LLGFKPIINRFEGNCGTFGKGKRNPMSSMTLGQFGPPKKTTLLFFFKPNDHGVDVNMIIVIWFKHIENNGI